MMFRLASRYKLYEDVRHNIKTGDVVAFSGHGTISDLIKALTGAPYSHVGLVFDVTATGADERNILFVESTVSVDLADGVRPEKIIEGVQMHFLSRRLDHYNGSAWLVPLKKALTAEQVNKMQAYARTVHNEMRPFDWRGLLGLGFELVSGLKLFTHPDFSAFFCSEFVTRTLIETGIVPEGVNPSRQTPASVVNSDCFEAPILLKN